MLCRTANELYWMGRHIERAENTARLLDVTYRMALLPYEAIEPGLAWAEPWAVPLITSGLASDFYDSFQQLSAENVLRYMILDASNTSSIYCCLRAARESARAVRGAITSEMYEDLNSAWLDMRAYDYNRIQASGVSEFLEWVKMRSHLFRGVTFGTMLRDEAYHFIRLGTHIERADNTARILDVKYHLLLPPQQHVGGPLDYFQWAAILRSVSALTSYHWVYRESLKPWLVADLLMLNEQMPRSLASCYQHLVEHLDNIARIYGRQGQSQRHARSIRTRLQNSRMEEIFQRGLHEFIGDFISDNNRLGALITEQYLL
jgi:uncharacterized alpha-E superfamily protein